MEEIIRQIFTYARGMWKHRWLGVAVAWLAGGIGAGFVMRIPDQYEATARVYVDTQSILKPLMAGLAVQPNVEQQIMMLSRTLMSRPNVEKLVRMADLDLGSTSKADQDALVDGLMKSLAIQSTSRDNLYTVSYRNADAEKAKRVVQSLVSIFVESGLGDKRKDTTSAKKFIEDQIQTYEQKLEEAEARLKQFKLRNIELATADGKMSTDRLSDISAQLSKARLDLREAENSRDALKKQIVGEEPVLLPESANSALATAVPELDSRIDAQKRSLDGLLQRYTEQHPDVVSARRLIKELEEQKRAEVAIRRKAAAANPASASLSNNPVYQQLKVSYAEAEASVASLKTRVAEYETRLKRVTDAMKFAPQLEAEFTQLNRDYDVHKRNYEALVSRRESATLSGDLESVAGIADFRLIDPPRVSPKPVYPNRFLMLPMALLIALGAGVAVSFIASQLRPVFLDGSSLRDVTGLPLLGTVTRLVGETTRLRERASLRRFAVACGGLVGAFAAGISLLAILASRSA